MTDVMQAQSLSKVPPRWERGDFLKLRLSHRAGRQATRCLDADPFNSRSKPTSSMSVFLCDPSHLRRVTLAVLVPLAVGLWCGSQASAQALPGGGHFVAGSGTIGGNGTTLTINQSSPSGRGIIDWNSFSIGNGHNVVFNNGSGATLNRVTGGNTSVIIGALSATGSLYLINPQGIVVGPTGLVSTGGRFVASTLDTGNDAFMQGGPLTLTGNSTASVVNLGTISSTGGDVFLIARNEVVNQGAIIVPNGSAELAVGQEVLLQDSSSSPQVSVLAGSAGNVLNLGTISAAQVSLQAADGNVYALAGNDGAIRATGTATRDGHIWLVADQGRVTASGTLKAVNADGTGGTVETDANTLSVDGATVSAGTWKLATPLFTLDSSTTPSFTRSLNAGTSIDLTATGTGSQGNITVASNLQWNGAASLSLDANHDVIVDPHQVLQNTGSGNLTLRADNSAQDNGGSVANFGTVDWSGSSGIVSMLYDMNGSDTPGTLRSNPAWTAAPYSGLLSQITTYKLVNSMADLQNVALDLGGVYALGVNLDDRLNPQGFNAFTFNPLGSVATPFTGQFDGMGHTIDELSASVTAQLPQTYGELFGVIGAAGVVRNVGVTNVQIYSNDNPTVVGMLAGQNLGTIVNTYTTGYLGFNDQNTTIGGLVGVNRGLIERSWSSATNFGNRATTIQGRLVGSNYGTIAQSYVVVADEVSSGGLVGDNYGTITQSYAVDRTFNAVGVGGLVSNNESSGVINQSFVTGTLEGVTQNNGAIAGINSGTIDNDVYWDAQTTGLTQSSGSGTQLPAANGLTTAQMSVPSSFASWDFSPTGVWTIPAGGTYPILRWQLAQ